MWPIIFIAVGLGGASGLVLGAFAIYYWLLNYFWDNESGNE